VGIVNRKVQCDFVGSCAFVFQTDVCNMGDVYFSAHRMQYGDQVKRNEKNTDGTTGCSANGLILIFFQLLLAS
jgi:ABC-type molybdate transport system substrate-binding protein